MRGLGASFCFHLRRRTRPRGLNGGAWCAAKTTVSAFAPWSRTKCGPIAAGLEGCAWRAGETILAAFLPRSRAKLWPIAARLEGCAWCAGETVLAAFAGGAGRNRGRSLRGLNGGRGALPKRFSPRSCRGAGRNAGRALDSPRGSTVRGRHSFFGPRSSRFQRGLSVAAPGLCIGRSLRTGLLRAGESRAGLLLEKSLPPRPPRFSARLSADWPASLGSIFATLGRCGFILPSAVSRSAFTSSSSSSRRFPGSTSSTSGP